MSLFDRIKERSHVREPIQDALPEEMGTAIDVDGQSYKLHRGQRQYAALTPDQLERVASLRTVLVDAYPMTLDGWVDGFARDINPESEIAIMEALAVVYQRLTSACDISIEEKKRLYGVLCVMSSGVDPLELADSFPPGLPPPNEIHAMFRSAFQNGDRP